MDIKNVKIGVRTKKLCSFEVWSVLSYAEYAERTRGMVGVCDQCPNPIFVV